MIWAIYIILFFMGATIFSFINVLIYRVPRHMPFGNERSICPKCGNTLKAYDLVPVFSFLILGGKCRFCKSKISLRYPLIELLGGVLVVMSFQNLDIMSVDLETFFLQGTFRFFILAMLTAVAFVDLDTMEIPNGFNLTILILGVISVFVFPDISIFERAIGVFCVSVPMLLLTLLIAGAFGGGDMKLMGALGLFFGWKLTLCTFFFAILAGGAYGIYLLATKKKERKDHFAFGPFLCVGAGIAMFWGEQILTWYLGGIV